MFTNNQIETLAILINHPNIEYYMSELGVILKKHPGTFQRGINSLEKQGLILSRKKGNQRLFKINQSHPLFEEIKGITQKTKGVETLLRQAVKNIKEINIALIYGSYVKGLMRQDSDVDILVTAVNSKAEDILLDKLVSIERNLQREVNYKIYTKNEFEKKIKEKDPFLEEVLSDKYILLKGKI